MSKKNKNRETKKIIDITEEAEVVNEVEEMPPEVPVKEKKSKRKFLIGAGVALGVIGAIGACIFAGRNSGADYLPDGDWDVYGLDGDESEDDDESDEESSSEEGSEEG